jgi:ketosteroid isomerase-like protein
LLWGQRDSCAGDVAGERGDRAGVVHCVSRRRPRWRLRPLLVHFDPEVLVNQPPELPDAKSYRRHDGVVEAFGDWPSQWDELRVEVLVVIDGDETVVHLTRQYMRAREIEIEQDVAFVYTFKDRKIIGWDAYFAFDKALSAAGLRE